jgi:REase_DpnII-MboI
LKNLEARYARDYAETLIVSSMLKAFYLKPEFRNNQEILLLSKPDVKELEVLIFKIKQILIPYIEYLQSNLLNKSIVSEIIGILQNDIYEIEEYHKEIYELSTLVKNVKFPLEHQLLKVKRLYLTLEKFVGNLTKLISIDIKEEDLKKDVNSHQLENNQIFDLIFNKFHLVAKQLERRYRNRPTIHISDEYDVQNILRSLFELFFSDIRDEENTPSFTNMTYFFSTLALTNASTISAIRDPNMA